MPHSTHSPVRTKDHTSRRCYSRTVVLLGLSATILPSWKILIVLGIIIAIITALSWRLFVKIYSKAQVSLRETLDQPTVVTERTLAAGCRQEEE